MIELEMIIEKHAEALAVEIRKAKKEKNGAAMEKVRKSMWKQKQSETNYCSITLKPRWIVKKVCGIILSLFLGQALS